MLWLDEVWPEIRASLYDVVETTFVLNAGTPTPLVKANPYRTSLTLAMVQTTNAVTISTTSAPSAASGFQLTTQVGQFRCNWIDDGSLPMQAWFAFASIGALRLTTIEIILQRPIVRPPSLAAAGTSNGKTLAENLQLAKLLRKQQKWRRKVYQMLQERGFYGSTAAAAGAGLAELDGGGFRYPGRGVQATRPVPPIFTRHGVGGLAGGGNASDE